MDTNFKDMLWNMLRMSYVHQSEGVLRNHHFFQDERLAEDAALPMQSSYFRGRQKGLYGVG